MAAGTTVEIEPRAEAVRNCVDLHKYDFRGVKERFFIGAETGERTAGSGR
jgi:hypothetical protein